MKVKIYSEVVYVVAIILLGLGVALVSSTDFGVSMIAAPAYILSLKTGLLFGQCEYIIQGIVFVLFCILVRKVKWVYFCSFLTCIFYGGILDFWRMILSNFPFLNSPYSFFYQVLYFIIGFVITTFSVALFFRTYLYPIVLDFFVKGLCSVKKFDFTKFKVGFDFSCLFLSCLMSFLFFHKLVGIGIGTVIMTVLNGFMIGIFGKIIDRCFEINPCFIKFSKYFDI